MHAVFITLIMEVIIWFIQLLYVTTIIQCHIGGPLVTGGVITCSVIERRCYVLLSRMRPILNTGVL
mgnify:CR=1 FL=1